MEITFCPARAWAKYSSSPIDFNTGRTSNALRPRASSLRTPKIRSIATFQTIRFEFRSKARMPSRLLSTTMVVNPFCRRVCSSASRRAVMSRRLYCATFCDPD